MRYTRQEILKEIGTQGQKKLSKKTVAIVGLGALGSVSSQLLARAGVGKLIIIDKDIVTLDNLQRQILYNEQDPGKPKAEQAEKALKKINSGIEIIAHTTKLNQKNIELLKEADLILDCTDNIQTRFLINDYCVKNKKSWIYTAAIKTYGTLMNFLPKGPCFKCVFKASPELEDCQTAGILNTATTTIASMQTTEAIKILLNKNPEKDMLRINLWNQTLDKINVKKRKDCGACAKRNFKHLQPEENRFIIKKCKTRVGYLVTPKGRLTTDLNYVRKNFKVLEDAKIVLAIKERGEEIIIKKFGALFFKGTKKEDKIAKIAKKIYNLR